VPAKELRAERQVSRRRRQLVEDRVRVQLRIKAELTRVNVVVAAGGKWSLLTRERLSQLKVFPTRWEQESFARLLSEYDFLCQAVAEQTKLLKALAETERYRAQVAILTSIPGVGLICAMEILLEIGDVTRFARAKQLAGYLGLTPSQDSSGDHVRLGRITKSGKGPLRGLLIEAAWILIRKDAAMRAVYSRIRSRAGAKRAIVAVARRMMLRARRMLLDRTAYALGVVA
jgi:transposase